MWSLSRNGPMHDMGPLRVSRLSLALGNFCMSDFEIEPRHPGTLAWRWPKAHYPFYICSKLRAYQRINESTIRLSFLYQYKLRSTRAHTKYTKPFISVGKPAVRGGKRDQAAVSKPFTDISKPFLGALNLITQETKPFISVQNYCLFGLFRA